MAIYVHVQSPSPGTNGVIFRWNNGNNKVDEGPDPNSPNSYDRRSGGTQNPVQLTLYGPATMQVEGYADDDADDNGFWPSAAQHENDLGIGRFQIDPDNLQTVIGQRQLGPTVTDNLHTGYQVQLVITSQ